MKKVTLGFFFFFLLKANGEADSTSYKNPLKYKDKPWLAGYISEGNLEFIRSTIPFEHGNFGGSI